MKSECSVAQEQKDLRRALGGRFQVSRWSGAALRFWESDQHGGAKSYGATTSSSVTLGRGGSFPRVCGDALPRSQAPERNQPAGLCSDGAKKAGTSARLGSKGRRGNCRRNVGSTCPGEREARSDEPPWRRVVLMLTLARAMHVGEPARVNWNGNIRTGVTSIARASVAQAAGDRDIRTAIARCVASVSDAWATASARAPGILGLEFLVILICAPRLVCCRQNDSPRKR